MCGYVHKSPFVLGINGFVVNWLTHLLETNSCLGHRSFLEKYFVFLSLPCIITPITSLPTVELLLIFITLIFMLLFLQSLSYSQITMLFSFYCHFLPLTLYSMKSKNSFPSNCQREKRICMALFDSKPSTSPVNDKDSLAHCLVLSCRSTLHCIPASDTLLAPSTVHLMRWLSRGA